MINLNDIHSPEDIKGLSIDELNALCQALRKTLLKKLSAHGGHVGPNLGFLEATVALHYVFDTPKDKIVYDVSHQSYVHKMLTGRMEAFTDPAHYNDVTGYTAPRESPEYDLFEIGHTSTAVSLAGGLAAARNLTGGNENVIAVVGDGSLSGGEAFEGLDFGATLDSNFIVVVNDNQMSIAENHGGLYQSLQLLRKSNGTAQPNYFEALGYDYLYVNYGNDIRSLVEAFRKVKDSRKPVVVHLNTQKGMGYAPAEAHEEHFHYQSPFDLSTGDSLYISQAPEWSEIFYQTVKPMMEADPKVAVITAGTAPSLGFTPERRKEAGHQFIDVGIAEQQAVALASGMAKGGARPVFGVISSFIQRAYDQLSQDVAINETAPVLSIFYTGINGMTDTTHLGWFDIPLISNIPNWVFLSATCKEEYEAMLRWAVEQTHHPVVVRTAAGSPWITGKEFTQDYSQLNRSQVVEKGKDVAVIAEGSMLRTACEAAKQLKEKGINITVINPVFISGLDVKLLTDLAADHKLVITMEDGALDGGYGEKVARFFGDTDMKVICRGIPKEFLDGYNPSDLLVQLCMTPELLASDVETFLSTLK